MKRKLSIITCIVSYLLCCVISAGAAAKDLLPIEFYDPATSQYATKTVTAVDLAYDGALLHPDVPAFIDRGRTLVPIYMIGDLLDAKVEWNSEFERATIETANTLVILTIGSDIALVNGQQIPLPDGIPAALVKYNGSNRTMVPWRFVAEQLGARVEWDPDTYTVTIYFDNQPEMPNEDANTVPEPEQEDVPDDPTPEPDLPEDPVPEEPVLKESLEEIIVVLDAGHGGSDPGASGYSAVEKKINMAITEKAQTLLLSKGLQVLLTRSDDSHVSLSERTTYANNVPADIFVSIHSNSVENAPSASGIETYYCSDDILGQPLAASIQDSVILQTGAKNRKTKTANFYVCKYTLMPSALVEVGFLTNAVECKKLASDEYQQLLAEGIVEGILTFANEFLLIK